MHSIKRSRVLDVVSLFTILLLFFSPYGRADDLRMLATINDVFIFYGEGVGSKSKILDDINLLRLEGGVRGDLAGALNELVSAYGGEELPWDFSRRFSRVIRLSLNNADIASVESGVVLEFIAVQYLSKCYLGMFELAPEEVGKLVSKNELELIGFFDGRYSLALDRKGKGTWLFVKEAVSSSRNHDVNKNVNRCFPLVVYRGVRGLTR